ncbi:MAG: methyltransferase [Opitutaceae bacterium]
MSLLAKTPPPLALLVSIGAAVFATRMWPVLQLAWFRAPIAAAVVGVGALAWIIWAAAEFRRYRTTILPLRQPTRLLERGPFRLSRNPIYIGMLTLTLVPWLGCGSIGLLFAPVLFVAVINGAVIPFEEEKLRRIFGTAYDNYVRRVRRWL